MLIAGYVALYILFGFITASLWFMFFADRDPVPEGNILPFLGITLMLWPIMAMIMIVWSLAICLDIACFFLNNYIKWLQKDK